MRFIRLPFQWVNKGNWRFLAITMAYSFGYYALQTPISRVIADQIGEFRMTAVLAVSSAFALLGYPLTARLNCRFGSDRVCRIVLPLYAANLLLFLVPQWIPYAWVCAGIVNSVAYTGIDALFREGVSEGTKSKEEANTAIGTKEYLSFIASGTGALLAGLLVSVALWAWIVLVFATMTLGYIWVWQVRLHPQAHRKEPKEKSGSKPGWHLYMIAVPYLGIALANSAFTTFLPLDIGSSAAGLVLLVNRFAAGFANLLATKWYQCKDGRMVFRQSIFVLILGILLIPGGKLFSEGVLRLFCFVSAGILIGVAVSCGKLIIIHLLRGSVPRAEQGRATAPLYTISELGFLISMPTFGMVAEQINHQGSNYTPIWMIAAALPALSLLARNRKK